MMRAFWIAFGVVNHALFAFTVWHVYWFLKGAPPPPEAGSLLFDALLSLVFAVPHSVLLLPAVRKWIESWSPAPLYGCIYCFSTCWTLLTVIFLWQRGDGSVWQLAGWPRLAMQAAFLGSWGALFYSLKLTGFGYQTGWTTWSAWVRHQPIPRRRFEPRGVYRILRHPVYLSFLGLLWFTPDMTVDRALLAGIWSVYVFIGSHLKDRRLVYYTGDVYRRYQSEVAGYPGILVGPLARIPFKPIDAVPDDAQELVSLK